MTPEKIAELLRNHLLGVKIYSQKLIDLGYQVKLFSNNNTVEFCISCRDSLRVDITKMEMKRL